MKSISATCSIELEKVHKNFTKASIVCVGCSSIIQWPEFSTTTTLTSVATSFACSPNGTPNDLSPPIDSTGIVNLVLERSSKSLAACMNDTKYSQAARIRPGREYASRYALRSACGSE